MTTKVLILLIVIGLFSCKGSDNTNYQSKHKMILNLKNTTGAAVQLLLVNKGDSMLINLAQDSTMEIVGLKDTSYSFNTFFEETIKEKVDFISYLKQDSSTVVLFDEKKGVLLTDQNIILNSKGSMSVKQQNSQSKIDNVILNFPLE